MAKKRYIGFKADLDLFHALTIHAWRNSRTLSQEIIYRLKKSLGIESINELREYRDLYEQHRDQIEKAMRIGEKRNLED